MPIKTFVVLPENALVVVWKPAAELVHEMAALKATRREICS
jgi:hypothetical protein